MKAERYPHILPALNEIVDGWTGEHRFHHTRKWRFDFAHVQRRVAIEIDGGVWSGGRHSGGAGQIGDMEKHNAAAVLGWRVLRFTPQQTQKRGWLRAVSAVIVGGQSAEEYAPTDRIRRKAGAVKRAKAAAPPSS